ncbi:MAG TPA: hypothetical protein VI383_02140 [Gemmatimonadales bacterium]|nr:hypothetical protein [Gemmatimonadales bacterium]
MKTGGTAVRRWGRGLFGLSAALPLCHSAALAQDRPCRLQLLEGTTRQMVRSQVTPTTENYFAGGNPVRLRCRGQNVFVSADSIASYQGQVVQFIGNFRYQDETARVRSDFGTYIQGDERWEARGRVVYLNLRDSSRLEGPSVNYLRGVQGIRNMEEAFADQRPRLILPVREAGEAASEPYIIVADRLRLRGQTAMWGGGRVTVDRSDLRGRGDSLQLDTGPAGTGALIGAASIRRAAEDSFALAGKRIDLTLAERELTSVTGRDSATVSSRDLDLGAEAIRLRLVDRKIAQTFAWGKDPRPEAVADEYQIRGDSLAVDTPDELLREFRVFGRAWVGLRPDSAQGERDWIAGDTVRAEFEPASGAAPDQRKSVVRRLEARHSAASFYRVAVANAPGGRPTINYSRADRILLVMEPGDSVKVERVEMTGKVDGVQLEPSAVVPDSLRRPASLPGAPPRIPPRPR